MATLAVAARAETSSSSSSLKLPFAGSVRYRFPKTWSRSRIGTPRKPCMAGCPAGNPDERGSSLISETLIGSGCSMSAPSRPRPLGS